MPAGRWVVFDTNVYVAALREGVDGPAFARILGTRTETETIHRALDLVADEAALVEALRSFVVKGRGHIEDLDARR